MGDTFTVVNSLPDPATRDDFEKMSRTMIPTSTLIDSTVLQVNAGVITLQDNVGRWVKVTKTYADFTAAGLTESITAHVLAAGQCILKAMIDVTEAWVIAGMSTLDLELGISGTLGKYSNSSHVDGEGVSRGNVFDPPADDGIESMTASTNILLTATSDAGNLSTATAGSVDVWLFVAGTVY